LKICVILLDLLPSKILDEASEPVVYMNSLDLDPNSSDGKADQFDLPLCLWGWQDDKPSELVVYLNSLALDLHSLDAKAGQLGLPLCLLGWQDDKPQEKELYLKRIHPNSSGG
jgi:hypothetical protein